jgi:KDO2-lipid IV(A) lauroyltransferase
MMWIRSLDSWTRLRRGARYHAGRVLLGAASRLPAPVGRTFGAFLGVAAWGVIARDRRIAEANLAAAHPDWSAGDVRRAARAAFAELGRNVFDVAAAPRWSPAVRQRRITVEGAEHLEAASAGGRGVLLFGGHQGAWELVAVALGDRGFRVTGLARPIREARLDRALDAHRAALGITTLKVGTLGAARAAHRALAGGGLLACLIDHRIRAGGRVVSFFGRPARFATGPFRLAAATDARLVPVQIRRGNDGGHVVVVHPPLPEPPRDRSPALRVAELVDAGVAALERMIAADPGGWAWMHPRWGRPERAAAVAGRLQTAGFLAAALCAAALAVAGGAAGCGESRTPTGEPPTTEGPSSVLAGLTLRETEDGRLRWILTADSSETWEQPNQTLVKRLHIDFYDPTGAVSSVLTSNEGLVLRSTNDLTARGNVRLVSKEGDTLTTERLDWNNLAGRLSTDLPFRLAGPDGALTGIGFETDPGLRNYTTKEVRIDGRDGTDRDRR